MVLALAPQHDAASEALTSPGANGKFDRLSTPSEDWVLMSTGPSSGRAGLSSTDDVPSHVLQCTPISELTPLSTSLSVSPATLFDSPPPQQHPLVIVTGLEGSTCTEEPKDTISPVASPAVPAAVTERTLTNASLKLRGEAVPLERGDIIRPKPSRATAIPKLHIDSIDRSKIASPPKGYRGRSIDEIDYYGDFPNYEFSDFASSAGHSYCTSPSSPADLYNKTIEGLHEDQPLLVDYALLGLKGTRSPRPRTGRCEATSRPSHPPTFIRVYTPTVEEFSGIYVLKDGEHRGMPQWENRDKIIYSGIKGHWLIARKDDVAHNVGYMQSRGAHGGKYPTHPSLWWQIHYGRRWTTDTSVQITEAYPTVSSAGELPRCPSPPLTAQALHVNAPPWPCLSGVYTAVSPTEWEKGCCRVYLTAKGRWMVTDTYLDVARGVGCIQSACTGSTSPADVGEWQCRQGRKWVSDASITIVERDHE